MFQALGAEQAGRRSHGTGTRVDCTGSRLWVRCAGSAFLHVRAASGATGRIQRYPLLLGRCRTGQEPADALDTEILGTGGRPSGRSAPCTR